MNEVAFNPFPGADSLSSDYRVFGRDEEIAKIRSLLLAERVVVLHGVSGSGKSSLLCARQGLRDRFDSDEEGFSVLGPAAMRLPTDVEDIGDIYELTLIDELHKQEQQEQQEETDQIQGMMDLELLLLRHAQRRGSHYQLLIIDQFEEVFTKYPHDNRGREEFFGALGELLERNTNVRLLLSMRDEFLGELDRFRRFIPGRLGATFRLELLRKEMAVEVIEKTALECEEKIRLCHDDVERLVDNLSAQGKPGASGKESTPPGYMVEPLFLQLACRDAWQDIHMRAMVVRKNQATENDCVPFAANTSSTELDAVLKRFFDTALSSGSEQQREQEPKLRMFIHDGLISPNGLRTMISLERASRDWGLEAKDIKVLVDEHLVRRQQRNQLTYYELAHDRLVRPLQESNEAWLARQPGWRRVARNWQLGGSGSHRLSIAQHLRATTARHMRVALMPYELTFLDQQRRYSLLRGSFMLFALVTVGALFWSWFTVKDLKQDAQDLKQAAQSWKSNINGLESQYLNLSAELESKRDALENEENRSAVLRLLNVYTQRNWVERRDQEAILQVSEAYAEMKRRFPDVQDQGWASGAFFSAFDNALKPLHDAPGLSRTITVVPGRDSEVAFFPGDTPMMAYLHPQEACIKIRYLRKNGSDTFCLYHPGGKVAAIQFSPKGQFLTVTTENVLVMLDISRIREDHGEIEPAFRIATEGAINALTFSVDEQQLAYLDSRQVMLVCAQGGWSSCGSLPLQGWNKTEPIVQLALGDEQGGVRLLAVGGRNGSVAVLELDRGAGAAASDAGGAMENFTVRRIIGRFQPPGRKYKHFTDDRAVMSLGFLAGTTPRLIVAHRDTQLYLIAGQPGATELEKVAIVPDLGDAPFGVGSEQDNDHLQAATIGQGGILYTVVEDQITTWALARATIQDPMVKVRRLKTEARELRMLAAGKKWLLGQGFFYTWAWEKGVSMESRLIREKLPVEDTLGQDELIFYPQAVLFGAAGEILSGSSQHGLISWSPEIHDAPRSSRFISNCPEFDNKAIRAMALSPNRKLLAIAMGQVHKTRGSGQFMVVSTSDPEKKLLCDVQTHTDGLWAVAFNHNGHWLASGDWSGKLVLWSVDDDGKISLDKQLLLAEPEDSGREQAVMALAFHPGHDLLAVGNGSGQVRLYNIDAEGTLAETAKLEFTSGRIGAILDIEFSQNGKWLAAAGAAGPVQLWRIGKTDVAADAKPQVTPERLLPGHPGGTRTVAFHPAQEVLASGGADGAVRISHFARSEDVPTILRGIDADVLSLAWSEEGTELVVSYKHPRAQASADGNKEPGHGAVHVWSWDLEDIASIACQSVWRSLNPEEWAQWIQPVSAREYDPACSAIRE